MKLNDFLGTRGLIECVARAFADAISSSKAGTPHRRNLLHAPACAARMLWKSADPCERACLAEDIALWRSLGRTAETRRFVLARERDRQGAKLRVLTQP